MRSEENKLTFPSKPQQVTEVARVRGPGCVNLHLENINAKATFRLACSIPYLITHFRYSNLRDSPWFRSQRQIHLRIKLGWVVALTGLELASETTLTSNLQLSSCVSSLIIIGVGYCTKF